MHGYNISPRLLIILLAGCIFCALSIQNGSAQTPLTTERVATGFDRPLFVGSPPGDLDRLFVAEQGGRIKIIKNGAVLGTPFIDLSSQVSGSGGERGLLGVAFHPDYRNNGFFYVNYTRSSDHATVVVRYKVSTANPDVADPAGALFVLGPVAQPFSNHNGGNLQFGSDGKLYIGMGDGGSGGDPSCNAQRGDTLLGKILRINDDGTVPPDNPFVGNPDYLDPIFALGLRNPWRFSFDRGTGDLYIGDVGQGALEEIDFQSASSTGGENYGWKIMEGTGCFSTAGCPADVPGCNDAELTLPIHEYPHTGGKCSITGGFVYRGCAVPDLRGTYFFADFCTAQIWSFRFNGSTMTDFQERTSELAPGSGFSINLVSSFGEDGDGEIYIVDRGSSATTGEIYKIVPAAPAPFEDLGFAKAGGGGVEPRLEVCGLTGTGSSAVLRLRKARPSTQVALVVSLLNNPVPLYGGTLVPGLTASWIRLFQTGSEGEIIHPFPGGGGPLDVFMQYVIRDPGAAQGFAFSNAIKVILQP